MTAVKKEDLNRFKKTMQGLIDFAVILEQAAPSKRARIIRELEIVDRPFLRKVQRKVVYFEELVHLDETVLAEILSQVTPNILACALKDMPEKFKQHFLRQLAYPIMKATLDEEEKILKTTSRAFIEGAQRQVLKIGRDLEKKNRFVFELADCPRFHEEGKKKSPSPKKP